MKSSKSISVILLILLLLAGGSCCCGGGGEIPTSTPSPTASVAASPTVTHTPIPGYLEYVDDENGFAISYPQDWMVPPREEWPEDVLAMFKASSACGNFTSTCAVDTLPLPAGSTVEAWVNGALQVFAAQEGYSYMSHNATVVCGRDATEHVYLWDNDGVTVYTVQLYVADNDTVWVLSCGSSPGCWGQYESVFERVLYDFRLID